ncbi:MAG: hypothetical protein AB2L14_28470 [Candidatus Xenobiia bacterium LiM19]
MNEPELVIPVRSEELPLLHHGARHIGVEWLVAVPERVAAEAVKEQEESQGGHSCNIWVF